MAEREEVRLYYLVASPDSTLSDGARAQGGAHHAERKSRLRSIFADARTGLPACSGLPSRRFVRPGAWRVQRSRLDLGIHHVKDCCGARAQRRARDPSPAAVP